MVASASTRKGDEKGRPNPAQENCDGSDLELCPDLVLAALAAAAAAGFAVLYTQITMAGRKKKRSADSRLDMPLANWMEDMYWHLGTLSSLKRYPFVHTHKSFLNLVCKVRRKHPPRGQGREIP